ncbi:MAG: prepilin-type N-terminal cleavage/methylation domain-containing protein [Burkholderiales bacterium]|jgi:type IV pilus assembly protein PilE|nr:prepilin-type N-terminal cleavage/methylation domain-containing protein [Burkholderiales bacterium]
MRFPIRPGRAGFTLIELMVAVVVAGILAAVAYPAMTSFIQRSRRADAAAVLTTVVQAQERYRSNHATYSDTIGTGGLGLNNISAISQHYDVSLTGVGNPVSFVSGYVVTATARSTSPQSRDSECASLSIKLEGAMFSYLSANSSQADTSSRCWSH